MSTSSDNFPITDAPTRDPGSVDSHHDALFETSGDSSTAIPKQLGDYEIRELIGSGGMGQVYLAEHTRMQRVVAIKMLPVHRMEDPRAVSRFYDEIRNASRLMHPNIVTAFDAGEAAGVHYLAMEYVEGETLTSLVSKNGPLSVGEAAGVIRQAALGLLHAHRAGIVHRDVKPGNLMRSVDGTIKVLDLGLSTISTARAIQEAVDATETGKLRKSKGKLVGTLPFMSPEQLEDPDSVDARSDIYSLGATFYFLLTARPPFTGEYLEQVYGHRHGEIPDLMQARDDVDLRLANVFQRMMAKSPEQRYGSLDEIIDEMGDYATLKDTPIWLAEYTKRQIGTYQTTVTAGSTSVAEARVMAIDFGMFYSAAAEGSPEGRAHSLFVDDDNRSLFRMAVGSFDDQLVFGNEAMDRRFDHSRSVAHSVPIYIGKSLVERKIAGRECPPEVLLALMFRRIRQQAWNASIEPHAVAVTVPGSFDQLHRRSVVQAMRIAGFQNIRLFDRSVAAAQSVMLQANEMSLDEDVQNLDAMEDHLILYVGVTGQASEISVIRRQENRLNQLSSAGHWHQGTLPWLHRLVDLAADRFIAEHRFDPRRRSKTASQLQASCERAMNSMMLLQNVDIEVQRQQESFRISLSRRHWLQVCEDLAAVVRKSIGHACRDAGIALSDVDCCLTQGPLMRMPLIRDSILRGTGEQMTIRPVDRTDAARGAAAALAAELPGRGDIAMPPRTVSSQTIGIVIEDAKGRRRILPIIPKGTSLPARTNRRLTVGSGRESMTLSLVESSGVDSDDWHALGRYQIHITDPQDRVRMIGFEVDINGFLKVRTQSLGTPTSTLLPPLPESMLSEEEIVQWTRWVDRLF